MFIEIGSSPSHRSYKGQAALSSRLDSTIRPSHHTLRWTLWTTLGLLLAWLLPATTTQATPIPRTSFQSSKKSQVKKRKHRWVAQRKPRRLRRGRPKINRPGTLRLGGAVPGASSISGKAGTTRVIGGRDNCRFSWRTKVRPDFKKADVLTLVKWIAKQTCQNFIVSDKVRGRPLYIISESDVTLRDAYRAFFTALRENQMIALRVGRFWKVIGANEGRQSPVITITNDRTSSIPGRDEMVTFLYRLKHLDPNKISGLLRQLVTAGSVIPYQASNVLIITDYGPNIRRVVNLVRALDVEQAETKDRLYILQVRHAQAQEIAAKIQQLFQVGNPTRRVIRRVVRSRRPTPTRITPKSNDDSEDANRLSKIVADERTNQLIVLCNPRALKRVSKLVNDLDIPLPDDGQIRVHNLKFATADELAQTLSQLTQGTSNNRTRFRRRRRTGGQKKASELFEGEVKITADKATNSLVIVASRRDYDSLSRIIDKLDIPRKQVFVEIVILEVSVNKTRDLGLTFSMGSNVTGDTNQPTVGLLGTQLGGQNSLILDPTALTGLAFGLQGATVPGTQGIFGNSAIGLPSFSVLIRALQTNTDVDVISTPHILTTANEEATLQVGQNVPFIAGTTFTGGSVAGVPAIRNIQRQDVALTLKLKPQIDAGSYIRIDFEQELTELAAQDPELGPTTAKRKIKTVVLAKDRQTIVIGGLIRDKVTNGVSKVPVLGDIPLLGALFRVQNRIVEKRNLLVFMTPYVITSMYDFRQIFRRKMEERQKFLDRFYAYIRRKVKPYVREDRMPGLFERVNMRLEHGKQQAKEMEEKGLRPTHGKKAKAPKVEAKPKK